MIESKSVYCEVQDKSSYEELLINLKSLSRVQVGDKLCATDQGRFFVKDTRVLQFLVRWVMGDNRAKMVEMLKNLYTSLNTALFAPESTYSKTEKLKLVHLVPSVIFGIENMKSTYQGDKITQFSLENIVDDFQSILTRWDN